jgi:uncharacterized protein (TIGR03663 family)
MMMESDSGAEVNGRGAKQSNEGGTSAAGSSLFASERHGRWLDWPLLALAVLLRFAWLEIKPPHFDEGVNGWFVDGMTRTGFYHYDPTNFHGPLHFYVLFVAQTLFGRHAWALRLPLVLANLGCVAFVLYGWRRFFSSGVCRLAALTLAISPGMVFFGRYAIHESWLVLFEMLAVWGLAGLWREGGRRDLWAAGLGFTGMILTKETWLIHTVALALAVPTVRLLEKFFASAPLPRAVQHWTWDDLGQVIATGIGLLVFFYSGCLLDPNPLGSDTHPGGISGLWTTFATWTQTGTEGNGHEKPWWYWFELLGIYEWPALLGFLASAGLVLRNSDRLLRYLAIAAGGTLTAYCIISYKTPWCIISIIWPFYFVFAVAVVTAMRRVPPWMVGSAVAILCAASLARCVVLNFYRYAASDTQPDEAEYYVYVQTRRDISKLIDPLRWLVARHPEALHWGGRVVQSEHFPLIWMLGDFTQITWEDENAGHDPMDADWLLVDETAASRVEDNLHGEYFKTPLQLRGMAPERSVLYLGAETFRDYFPGREPEFVAAEAVLLRDLEPVK